jgi:hypothetical protein
LQQVPALSGVWLFFSFFNHAEDVFQVGSRNFLLSGEEGDHFLVRVLEVIVHNAAYERAFVFVFRNQGAVPVRISVLPGGNIFFALQVLYHRSDGGIRRFGAAVPGQYIVN